MSNKSHDDLPIPVYLNQQIVFDLLAVKDDGFSMIRNVKTSASREHSSEGALEGGIGLSNVFALLGVQFSARKANADSENRASDVEQEKIYTPNSLFAKLRQMLKEDTFVLSSDTDFDNLKVGQFVEFEATLHKAPYIALIENILQLTKLGSLFGAFNDSQKVATQGKSKGGGNSGKNSNSEIKQMEDILMGMSPPDGIQLIGDMTHISNARAVLSTKPEFFIDKDVTEALDGEFRVFGKVTRVITDDSEYINLLDRTSFALIDPSLFDSFVQNQNVQVLRLPELEIKVSSPAIQIIPVAIFR